MFKNAPRNKELIEAANNQFTPANTIDVYGHGSNQTLEGNFAADLHDYLMKNSEYYKFSIENNSPVRIRLFSCQGAKYVKGSNSIAYGLSLKNKNAIITGSSTNLAHFNGNYVIRSDGKWFDFNKGVKSISSFNNNFNNGFVDIYHKELDVKWKYKY